MFFQSSRYSPSLWLITACPLGLVTPWATPPLPQSCVFWMASPQSYLSYGLFPSFLSSKSSANMRSTVNLLHCFPELFQTFFLRNLDHFEEFAIGQEVDAYSLLKFLPRATEKILPYGYAKKYSRKLSLWNMEMVANLSWLQTTMQETHTCIFVWTSLISFWR